MSQIGIYLSGTPGPFDRLALEWGRRGRGGVETITTWPLETVSAMEMSSERGWRLLPIDELPSQVPEPAFMRVRLLSEGSPGAALAVTQPVSYERVPLASRLEDPSLLHPNIRVYFPCGRLPRLSNGVAEVPGDDHCDDGHRVPGSLPNVEPVRGRIGDLPPIPDLDRKFRHGR